MADPIELESVSWRRPGVLEVLVSQKFRTKEKEPDSPDYREVFSGVENLNLVESYTRFEGAVSRKVCKYQSAIPLNAPKADPREEKEVWSASVVMNQRNIVLHPHLAAILKAGCGSVHENKVRWPRMIYKKMGRVDPLTGGEMSEEMPVKNPFYGTTSYFSPRIEIVREMYLDYDGGQISGDAVEGIGWLEGAVAVFPFGVNGRFIISGNGISRKKGRRVLRTVWMSDPSFPDAVYDRNW